MKVESAPQAQVAWSQTSQGESTIEGAQKLDLNDRNQVVSEKTNFEKDASNSCAGCGQQQPATGKNQIAKKDQQPKPCDLYPIMESAFGTFLIIFKVHGGAINLWCNDKMKLIGKSHSLKISCHDVITNSTRQGTDVKILVVNDEKANEEIISCSFEHQTTEGRAINSSDLAIFMSEPLASSRRVSYAVDLHLGTLQEGYGGEGDLVCEMLGTSYVYLDPRFSSQGIQRTPIIATEKRTPIGQLQIEYLIITNPIAFGQQAPRPDWLFKTKGLLAGHRGAGSGRRMDLPEELLENTVASLNYAHRNGADFCELDVLLSADGVPVVYHDFDVDAVAAQQSSDELGKFRVQANEFTVKQLRDFRLLALHDGEGCPYTLNVPNQAESNRPFPTLAEVLDQVDESCGLNIEIKWPQLYENGKMEARKYREINDFVDRIIKVVDQHARSRHIILESFDADLVIMLRMKQNKFPVIFLSQAKTDRYQPYMDMRARSVKGGIFFASAFDLAGVDLILDYYVSEGKKLVDFIESHDLVARAWGDLGSKPREMLEFLKKTGLQCITCDKIDLINQPDNDNGQVHPKQDNQTTMS